MRVLWWWWWWRRRNKEPLSSHPRLRHAVADRATRSRSVQLQPPGLPRPRLCFWFGNSQVSTQPHAIFGRRAVLPPKCLGFLGFGVSQIRERFSSQTRGGVTLEAEHLLISCLSLLRPVALAFHSKTCFFWGGSLAETRAALLDACRTQHTVKSPDSCHPSHRLFLPPAPQITASTLLCLCRHSASSAP